MKAKQFLLIPGPTPVPDAILQAVAQHPIGHRTEQFGLILEDVVAGLQHLAGCLSDVLILTTSGTGAMEAAIANSANRGDRILSCITGIFGERWARIAEQYGAEVVRLSAKYGEATSPQALHDTLSSDRERKIKVVLLTHNDTSTGVLNDVQRLAEIVHEHGALCLVDCVTSFAAVPIEFSNWHIDIMVTASQKALMLPPGLAFVFMSERAWEYQSRCNSPRYFFDLSKYRQFLVDKTTPFTPAVGLILGLKVSLGLLNEEGAAATHSRHRQLMKIMRTGLSELGLKLFVTDETCASPTITTVCPPSNVRVDALRAAMSERHNILIADGQEALKGNIFRIGHMGYIFERDMMMTLSALKGCLSALGHKTLPS